MCENSIIETRYKGDGTYQFPVSLNIDIQEGLASVTIDVDHEHKQTADLIDSLEVDEVFRASFDGVRHSVAVEITVFETGGADDYVDYLEELEDSFLSDDEEDEEDERLGFRDRLRVLFTGRL
jgi:hypothetical protein